MMLDHDYDPAPRIAHWAIVTIVVAGALGLGFLIGWGF